MLDEEILDRCREAGLRHIGVGIESLDDQLLRSLGRDPIARKHMEDIIRYCRKIGISVLANYILGFPGDTRQNMEKTLRFARKLNTPFASFHIFTPYPGTPIYQKEKDKIYPVDFEKFSLSNPVMAVEGLSAEELVQFMEKAYISYYYRPAWLWQYARQSLRSWFRTRLLTMA
jgi:radical SAM superfamily enzyme YgiQ (UPF0313 family)